MKKRKILNYINQDDMDLTPEMRLLWNVLEQAFEDIAYGQKADNEWRILQERIKKLRFIEDIKKHNRIREKMMRGNRIAREALLYIYDNDQRYATSFIKACKYLELDADMIRDKKNLIKIIDFYQRRSELRAHCSEKRIYHNERKETEPHIM